VYQVGWSNRESRTRLDHANARFAFADALLYSLQHSEIDLWRSPFYQDQIIARAAACTQKELNEGLGIA